MINAPFFTDLLKCETWRVADFSSATCKLWRAFPRRRTRPSYSRSRWMLLVTSWRRSDCYLLCNTSQETFSFEIILPFWKRGPKMDMDKKVTWKFLFGIFFSSTKLGNRTHNIFHALQVECPHLFTGVTNAQLMSGKSSVMRLLIAGRATKITLYDLSHWFGYNVLGTQCRKWESSAVR